MRSAVLVIATSVLFGCAEDPSATSSTTQDIATRNKIASNKIASNKIASNKIASNKIASNKIASNRLAVQMPEAGDLLSTADGRTVYSYIVSCAIPGDITLEVDLPGVPDTGPDDPYTCVSGHCTFPGGVGLAPEWLRHRLNHKGQEWVSACMFSRVNAHDTAEAISLRGDDGALAVSADEALLYNVEEGAFYGNMFNDEDEPIAWYSCEGEGQASGEFGGLVVRDCTEAMACKSDGTCDPSPACAGSGCAPLTCGSDNLCHDSTSAVITQCGFNWAGYCADYTPQYPSPYACRKFDAQGGYYGDCHDSPGPGKWKHIKEWDRVITTYVTP